jgi:hypothetical protein
VNVEYPASTRYRPMASIFLPSCSGRWRGAPCTEAEDVAFGIMFDNPNIRRLRPTYHNILWGLDKKGKNK